MDPVNRRPALHRLLLLLLWPAGCAGPGSDDDSAPLRETLDAILAADNAGDIERVMACYADDPLWLPPDGGVVAGREAIRARYAAAFARQRFELSGRVAEARAAGGIGWVRGETLGRLVPRDGAAPATVHDQYVALLVRDDGRWRIARLMWGPIRPP